MEGPALKKTGIVPDLVDHVDEDAAVTMHIRYGGRFVGNGNEIMPSEARLPLTGRQLRLGFRLSNVILATNIALLLLQNRLPLKVLTSCGLFGLDCSLRRQRL